MREVSKSSHSTAWKGTIYEMGEESQQWNPKHRGEDIPGRGIRIPDNFISHNSVKWGMGPLLGYLTHVIAFYLIVAYGLVNIYIIL